MEQHKLIKEKFGLHLRSLRIERNLSLRDLATLSEMHHSRIGLIELGDTELKLTTIFALARGLGVQPKELLNFDL